MWYLLESVSSGAEYLLNYTRLRKKQKGVHEPKLSEDARSAPDNCARSPGGIGEN